MSESANTSQNMEGFTNVQNQDAGAYVANYKAHKKGIDHSEMVQVYTDWAVEYDKDLCPGRYNGPRIAAEALAKLYPEQSSKDVILVIDVAAGTGRVGQELHQLGFKKIDALEPSEGMMQVLKDRNVYTDTFLSSIGFDRLEIPSNRYDTLVIAGGMGEGHIPVKAIDEMIRIVKPGGYVVIVMREEYLGYVEEYVGKLEPYMEDLCQQNKWKPVSREIVPEYSFNKTGVVYTYEVITSED